ncbi:hypothetical protein [Butyrivibrio sp. AE3004]|uniref:hypothetical protein n=1 Tax=Butyrivibrio sp. AE3004 TaxID=1506994 RepID=UPI000494C726|nr:hypothetical protein [Butyrivibrio sp. AE3004]
MNPEVQFIEILSKAGGEDLFIENDDGTLDTVVHTGRMLEAFEMAVEFENEIVSITTSAFLCVNESSRSNMNILISSMNEMCSHGRFYISEEKKISFCLRLTLNYLECLDNPFDAVFYGCELFERNQVAILKVLSGQSVMLTRIKGV